MYNYIYEGMVYIYLLDIYWYSLWFICVCMYVDRVLVIYMFIEVRRILL